MIKRDNWTTKEAIDILMGGTIAWCSEGGDIEDNPDYYANLDRNKGIHKAISDLKVYDRWLKKIWCNDELIELVEDTKISIKMDEVKSWSKAKYDSAVDYNRGLEQAVIQLWDLKANPETSYSAMALDTETGQIVVISPPLPR